MVSNPNADFTYPRKFLDPTEAHNGRALEDYLRDRAWRKITAEEIDADLIVVGDTIQSANYEAGSSGWIIHQDGSAEFNDVSVRGEIVATGGEIEELEVTGILYLGDGGIFATSPNTYDDRIIIDGTVANRRVISFTSGWADGGLVATDSDITIISPSPSTDYDPAYLFLEGGDTDVLEPSYATMEADIFYASNLYFIDDKNTGIKLGGSGEVIIYSDGEDAWGLEMVGDHSTLSAKGDIDDSIRFDQSAQAWYHYVGGTLVAIVSGDRLDVRSEYLQIPVKSTTGAPLTTPATGDMYLNTVDNNVRIYEGSAWRTVASW